MRFRVRSGLNYIIEIEVFCLMHNLEPPAYYKEEKYAGGDMVNIGERFELKLLFDRPEIYRDFKKLLFSFL